MERFWRKVHKTKTCWIWTAGKDWDGYGLFRLARPRRQVRAHRFSWEMVNGPIPSGLFVCHRCDNPSCVRPDHLFIGTAKDNNCDTIAKMRQPSGPGETNFSSKLKESDIRNIRIMRANGLSQQKIADKFGIGQSQVSRILRGEAWKHTALQGLKEEVQS